MGIASTWDLIMNTCLSDEVKVSFSREGNSDDGLKNSLIPFYFFMAWYYKKVLLRVKSEICKKTNTKDLLYPRYILFHITGFLFSLY